MNGNSFHRVAVLMGGPSSEHDVSMLSGRAVAAGLRAAGYDVVEVVLDNRQLRLPPGVEGVFIALHGAYGEDGEVQAELDRIAMPYTGAGAYASRLAFDKCRARAVLERHGIPVPPGQMLKDGEMTTFLEPPVVVKPPREGSSFGIEWVDDACEWNGALERARRYSADLLVECYIPGREWTAGIVDGQCLPLIEIIAPGGRFDAVAKYQPGVSHYVVVDERREPAAAACKRLTFAAYDAFGARGFGRVDFRLSSEGDLFVLELNTIPGFTPTSLLPKAALAAGMDFPDLCARIMETAAYDVPGVRHALTDNRPSAVLAAR